MFRPLLLIVAAIRLSRPEMPEEEAIKYARVLQTEAAEREFDPFTGVAMIHFESRWQPRAVSPSGEDFGLGQIRARYVGACQKDSDPVHHPSVACKKVKQSLLDPEENIAMVAELITHHRKVCKKKTGSARFAQWLASYQGRNYPKQNRWCQPGKKTWQVIEYRKHLIRKLVKH